MSATRSKATDTGTIQTWPPPTRHEEAEHLIARGMFVASLITLHFAGVLWLVPPDITWRHHVAACIFAVLGLILLRISWRLIQLTKGRGRRRARVQ
jgi:membrane protein implicated in regulation of membrane protease activity